MSLFSSFATDAKLEKEGIVVVYPDPSRKQPEAFRVRLARLSGRNRKYAQVKERLLKPYRGLGMDDLPEEVQDRFGRELFCEAVVLSFETKQFPEHTFDPKEVACKDGWLSGIEVPDGGGRVVPATPENLAAAFVAAPDFLTLLYGDATNADNYRTRHREADSKNS